MNQMIYCDIRVVEEDESIVFEKNRVYSIRIEGTTLYIYDEEGVERECHNYETNLPDYLQMVTIH